VRSPGEHLMSNRIQSYWDGILEDMRTTQQFSITLSLDMVDAVERKVKSGAYASVSEVVRRPARAPRCCGALATRGSRAGPLGIPSRPH
jgi:hypothetical protein